MLIFLPIMLCCSAQNFDLLCSILCSCERFVLKSDCSIRVHIHLYYISSVVKVIIMVSVLLEYIDL